MEDHGSTLVMLHKDICVAIRLCASVGCDGDTMKFVCPIESSLVSCVVSSGVEPDAKFGHMRVVWKVYRVMQTCYASYTDSRTSQHQGATKSLPTDIYC